MIRTCLLLVIAGAAVVHGLPAEAQQPAGDNEKALKQAMLGKAREVYQHTMTMWRHGTVAIGPEEMYRWSQRWLEAQRDLAGGKEERLTALREHLERMKGLEKIAEGQVRAGQGSQRDVAEASYYRLQAELWLSREIAR
jgi:hypothetical protein